MNAITSIVEGKCMARQIGSEGLCCQKESMRCQKDSMRCKRQHDGIGTWQTGEESGSETI